MTLDPAETTRDGKRSGGDDDSSGVANGERRPGGRSVASMFFALLMVMAACSDNRSTKTTSTADRPVTTTSHPHLVAPVADPIPITARQCLERPPTHVTVIAGSVTDQRRVDAPAADQTYDARTAIFTGDGTVPPGTTTPQIYPLLLGKQIPSTGTCVVGGSVRGNLDRAMTWPQLKAEKAQPNGALLYFDAAALTVFERGDGGHLVDGFRVDDVSDGVAARGSFAASGKLPLDGGNFYLRNAYFTYVHDDCVDVNDLVSSIVYDSLFDGCYTGVSERPDSTSPLLRYHAAPGQQFVLDHVLMHMAAFLGPHPTTSCPTGTPSGYNEMFKWSPNANDLVVRNSVFLLDRAPCSDRYFPFPESATLQNVTIVWAGVGPWRWSRPVGLQVTTDRSVWDTARVAWLRRHGCASTTPDIAATANACTNMTDPTP